MNRNRKNSLISLVKFNEISKILIKEKTKCYELDEVLVSNSPELNKEDISQKDYSHITALKFYQIIKKHKRKS